MADAFQNKLRVGGTVKDALLFPFRHPLALLRLGLVPGLIAAAICYALFRAFWPAAAPFDSPQAKQEAFQALLLGWIGINVVLGIVGVIVAVGIHRLIVNGEQPGWVLFRFGRYELAYAGAWLAIILIYWIGPTLVGTLLAALTGQGAPTLPPDSPPRPGQVRAWPEAINPSFVLLWLALIGLFLWLQIKLALIFPHAAVTGKISFGVSWRATRGNFWRFVGAGLLLILILLPIWLLISSIAIGVPPPGGFLFTGIALVVTTIVIMSAIGVAFISYIYRDLVDLGQPAVYPARF
jgi:hypothetical protein